jgi:hypothetical protein
MNLAEIIQEKDIVVELDADEVPAHGTTKDWKGSEVARFPKHKFPTRQVLINYITDYGNSFFMRYFAKGNHGEVYVPKDFTLKQSEAKTRAALMEEYKKHIWNDIHLHLPKYFMIGSDPEMFVEDSTTGVVVPAFEFLPPKKDSKGVVTSLYWDGFQAEFSPTAAGCLEGHLSNIRNHLLALDQRAKQYNKNAKLSFRTTMDIPNDKLLIAANEHVQFGCMPSLNAYGMKGIESDGRDVPFRPAGGHLHFGVGKKTEEAYVRMVKALDAITGVACVSLFAKFDDVRRRKLYGLAGEYRLPAHGLEYRVLSNAWLNHPVIANLVIDLARKSLTFGEKNLIEYWKGSEEETIRIINECDVEAARSSMEKNKEVYLKLFKSCYPAYSQAGMTSSQKEKGDAYNNYEVIYNIFLKGMESVVKTPDDVHRNWFVTSSPGRWRDLCGFIVKGEKV